MSRPDLFSTLSRYNGARSPENYLTEAFAYVLRELLVRQHGVGIELVNWLCGSDEEFAFAVGEDVSVATQATTEHGRPDMAISAGDQLAYVEVKDRSWLQDGQLAAYATALDTVSASRTRLVLLTRYYTGIPSNISRPVHTVRWFQVHDQLQKADLTDPVAAHLAGEFARYLEARDMAIQRVGGELAAGVVALFDFLVMLDAAIEAAGLKDSKSKVLSAGTNYAGWYIDSPKYWVGIGYDEPLRLWFQEADWPKLDESQLEKIAYERHRTTTGHLGFVLGLEGRILGFFDQTKEEQLDTLREFLETCYRGFEAARATVGETKAGREPDGPLPGQEP